MSLTMHGVVRAGHPLTEEPFRLVTWEDLAMVVSERADEPRHTGEHQRDALAHLAMLSRVVTDGPVVPLQFGTAAVDDDTVRTEVLAESATKLREHLDRLDGAVEVHAYLAFDESIAFRAVFDEHPAGWRAGDDLDLGARIKLGEQVAHRVGDWCGARSRELLAPVAAVARAQVSLADEEHTEQHHAFLVPTDRVDTVRAAIADLSNAADVTAARCVGPLPAYSFLAEPATPRAQTDDKPSSRWGW